MSGGFCRHGSLDSHGCSACEIDRLWDAIDRLWGWMPVAEVKAIRDEDPDLMEIAGHAHHRISHEQRMMHAAARTRRWKESDG